MSDKTKSSANQVSDEQLNDVVGGKATPHAVKKKDTHHPHQPHHPAHHASKDHKPGHK
jgi:hypothetical protein